MTPDHDSTFHVTEMPALITWPPVTSQTFKTVVVNSDERLLSRGIIVSTHNVITGRHTDS